MTNWDRILGVMVTLGIIMVLLPMGMAVFAMAWWIIVKIHAFAQWYVWVLADMFLAGVTILAFMVSLGNWIDRKRQGGAK